MPTKHEIDLALAKALLEVAEGLEKAEESEKTEWAKDPAYKHFYAGARHAGLEHKAAHKGAKSYAKDFGTAHGGTAEFWNQHHQRHGETYSLSRKKGGAKE